MQTPFCVSAKGDNDKKNALTIPLKQITIKNL